MNAPAPRARVTRSEAGPSRWEMATRPPAERLRPYLRDYVGYAERTPGLLRRLELPGPQVVMIFEFGPPIRVFDRSGLRASRYASGFVAGVDDTSTVTEHDGYQRGLQVNLTPIGARLMFGVPMSELTGCVVPAADLLPRTHRRLNERLEALNSWDARFDLIEQILSERVADVPFHTGVVSWAVDRIEASGGAVDIKTLAAEIGYSRKHVITLFREHVGVSPKLLARIVRFERLVRRLKAATPATWAELASEIGYYDQAHLVRDVRQFTGTTPTETRAMLSQLSTFAASASDEVNSVQARGRRAL